MMWWPVVGKGRVVYVGDVASFNLPVRAWEARQLAQGHLPLWCPDVLTGIALVAYQGCLFSPLTWLMAFGVHHPAWWFSFLTATLYLLAWAGAWALAHRLGLGRFGAAIAALAYTYCSPLPARHVFINMLEVTVLLPWILLGVEKMVNPRGEREVWSGLALTGGGFGWQMLAFSPQISLFSCGAVLTYALLRRGPTSLGRRLLLLMTAGAIAVAVGSAQYLPFVELVQWNGAGHPRGASYVVSYAPRARQLVGLVLPGFWGNPSCWLGGGNFSEASVTVGIVVAALFLLSLSLPQDRFPKRLLLGIAAGAAIVSFPTITQVHHLFAALPVLGTVRALGRCWFVASCALALVAGWSAEQLLRRRAAASLRRASLLLAAIVLPLLVTASVLALPVAAAQASSFRFPLVGRLDFLRSMPEAWASEYGLTGPGTLTALAALAGLALASLAIGQSRPRRAAGVLLIALLVEAWHVTSLGVPTTQPSPLY
ncbi:MAG: hypothetical protein J7M26_05840, partial [Armatimonadetes bacterium]|nr:hypothetical protein [Armatimonadota bacterium]